MRNAPHSACCAARIASSVTSTTRSRAPARSGTSARRRGAARASRPRFRRPSASTGRPASSARVQRRRGFRLDADDLQAARIPRGDPADQPAAADGDEQACRASGACSSSSRADRALAQRASRPGRRRAPAARRSSPPTPRSRPARRRSVRRPRRGRRRSRGCAACFGGRGHREQRCSPACPSCIARVRHRDAVIAAGGRDDAGRRHVAQQQIGEGAARLERPGVLQAARASA